MISRRIGGPGSALKAMAAGALLIAGSGCSGLEERDARSFRIEYRAMVGGFPQGARGVRIWFPLPRADEAQAISNLKVESPLPHRETREGVYGNRMLYFESNGALPPEIPIRVSFEARRLETKGSRGDPAAERDRLLRGDRLVPLEGPVARKASLAIEGKATAAEKARAIYEKVLADVSYDKTGDGWGRGDVLYVCRAGKGNCSDFHALFTGMARSAGIPAFFEIGFPVPAEKAEGSIQGYHCWAWYEEARGLWRPVDASEADKDPSKKEYFFGALCPNRVAFTRGRDLVLEPPQQGEPLNFFIHPHVEVDGQAGAAKVEKALSFRELGRASS